MAVLSHGDHIKVSNPDPNIPLLLLLAVFYFLEKSKYCWQCQSSQSRQQDFSLSLARIIKDVTITFIVKAGPVMRLHLN
jgi:hypothetical protein